MSSFWQSDLDCLVARGYPEKEVRDALAATNGDKSGAQHILESSLHVAAQKRRNGQVKKEIRRLQKDNLSWRKEDEDDWLDGVQSRALPTIPQNRALHKSPVYISVASYRHRTEEQQHAEKYNYTLNVILKDGRKWSVEKSYADFQRLKRVLPFSMYRKFKNKFPLPAACKFVFSKQSEKFASDRMLQLEEWVRELVLNERCMNNAKVLDALYQLIEAEQHGGPVDAYTATARALKGHTASSLTACDNDKITPRSADRQRKEQKIASPLLGIERKPSLSANEASAFSAMPNLDVKHLPLTVQQLSESLPVKINVKKLHSYETAVATAANEKEKKQGSRPGSLSSDDFSRISDDVSLVSDATGYHSSPSDMSRIHLSRCPVNVDMEQMSKDYGRDRVVIQGNKVSGAHTNLPAIIKLCNETIERTMKVNEKVLHTSAPGDISFFEKLSKCALQTISRTESAYFSHAALHDILDIENRCGAMNFTPFVIVPESELAEPISVNFKILERKHKESVNERRRRSHTASIRQSLNRGALWDDNCETDDADPAISITPSGGGGQISREVSAESTTPDASAFPSELPPRKRSLDRLRSYGSREDVFAEDNNLEEKFKRSASFGPVPLDWCIECEAVTNSVFRVIDTMTMLPMLQLKVTYGTKVFGLPMVLNSSSTSKEAADVVDMKVSIGKTLLGVQQISATTQRDWCDA